MRRVRFCGDCGYELARDNDGTCPMCRRFEQFRLDFSVPRPSDVAAHRAGSRRTDVPGAPDEWSPTVAEYRALLAERRLRSASPGYHAATVIRVGSSGAQEPMTPPTTASSSAPLESRDTPATPGSSTPPRAAGALTGTSASGGETLGPPGQAAGSLMQGGPPRHRALRSRTVVPLPSVITLAIVVASLLIGAAVPMLLSLP